MAHSVCWRWLVGSIVALVLQGELASGPDQHDLGVGYQIFDYQIFTVRLNR